MALIFCNYHFRLFRDHGIAKTLTDNPKAIIKIEKYGKQVTVCQKEHCSDIGEFVIDY